MLSALCWVCSASSSPAVVLWLGCGVLLYAHAGSCLVTDSWDLIQIYRDLLCSFLLTSNFPSQILVVSASLKSYLCLLCSVRLLCSAWFSVSVLRFRKCLCEEIWDNRSAYLIVLSYCCPIMKVLVSSILCSFHGSLW